MKILGKKKLFIFTFIVILLITWWFKTAKDVINKIFSGGFEAKQEALENKTLVC